MIRKLTAAAILLAGLALPAMAQPAIQVVAPLGHHGFISVGTQPAYVPAPVVVQPAPLYAGTIYPAPVYVGGYWDRWHHWVPRHAEYGRRYHR